jgi:hypothetical protein
MRLLCPPSDDALTTGALIAPALLPAELDFCASLIPVPIRRLIARVAAVIAAALNPVLVVFIFPSSLVFFLLCLPVLIFKVGFFVLYLFISDGKPKGNKRIEFKGLRPGMEAYCQRTVSRISP